jgi:hypothetical protein
MTQGTIDFREVAFNGPDYAPEYDNIRLGKQAYAIFNLMKDGKFRTLAEIKKILGYPESSISAQLRHFRKERFGGHEVERRTKDKRELGLFEYKLIPNKENMPTPF